MISFKHMEYFIEVANTKQISKASSNLNVSQSTITVAIKSIEEKINSTLLIRNHKGITLTYEGYLFLEHSKRVVASIKEMMNISSQSNFTIKGEIKIALSLTVSGYYFANYYSEFTHFFPNIKLTIKEANRTDIEYALVKGDYDIGLFNVVMLQDEKQLDYHTVFESRRNLWVNSGHKFTKKKIITLSEIAQEPSIRITVDEADSIANDYWKKYSLNPNIIFKTDSIEAVRSMVANGNGVAILSDMVYRPWSLEGKRIEKVTILEEIPHLNVGIVWAKNRKRNDCVNMFLNFMNVPTII